MAPKSPGTGWLHRYLENLAPGPIDLAEQLLEPTSQCLALGIHRPVFEHMSLIVFGTRPHVPTVHIVEVEEEIVDLEEFPIRRLLRFCPAPSVDGIVDFSALVLSFDECLLAGLLCSSV